MTKASTSVHLFVVSRDAPEHRALRARHRKERRFRLYGLSAIIISFLFLGSLISSIVYRGAPAFLATEIALPIYFDAAVIDPSGARDPDMLQKADYQKLAYNSLKAAFPEVTNRRDRFALYRLVSKNVGHDLRLKVLKNPDLIGVTETFWLPASSDIDMLIKGHISRDVPEYQRRVTDQQIQWVEHFEAQGSVRTVFNSTFLTSADSREPERAGIWGSIAGSLFTIFVCIGLSFPVGVCAAVYLEEFAPKNWFTDVIEVSVNNLAAVPSIVYGLLALAIFLNFFGLPRSSSLVGGLALALLVLPTIVIATRNALKSIPPSIRAAAIGLGASPIQVLMHHTLPLAMPGIMTGTILSVARALGETAPLLMIGMVAFVADVPGSFTEPATVLPVQIFLWSDSPELAFVEKTAAAIMILLGFLIVANSLAVYLRKKFERTW